MNIVHAICGFYFAHGATIIKIIVADLALCLILRMSAEIVEIIGRYRESLKMEDVADEVKLFSFICTGPSIMIALVFVWSITALMCEIIVVSLQATAV